MITLHDVFKTLLDLREDGVRIAGEFGFADVHRTVFPVPDKGGTRIASPSTGNSAPPSGVYFFMRSAALALILMWCAPLAGQDTENRQRPVFTMNISLKQSTTTPGSEVAIDIELTNVADKEIQIVRVSGPPLYTFKVVDQNGKAAPFSPVGEAIASGKTCWKGKNGELRCFAGGSAFAQRVAPGCKAHDVFVLSAYVNLSEPNEYSVQLERIDPYTRLLVESNTISLTVAQPK